MAKISQATLDRLAPHAKDYLRDAMHIEVTTKKAFTCLNPAHKDSHPSGFYAERSNCVMCHSCDAHYTLFDLIGMNEGLREFRAQVDRAAQLYGIPVEYETDDDDRDNPLSWDDVIDDGDDAEQPSSAEQLTVEDTDDQAPAADQDKPADQVDDQPADLSEFFAAAAARLSETSYHLDRGISAETCKRFDVGFVPEWRHPNVEQGIAAGDTKLEYVEYTPRLIIPTGPRSYIARDTRPDDQAAAKYRKMKVGESQIFNAEALRQPRPVFVVEGELDALSIEDVGGKAVGLGSTTSTGKLLDMIDALQAEGVQLPPLIIAMDTDDAGKLAAEKLRDGFKARGVNGTQLSGAIVPGAKDANAALCANRAVFAAYVAAYEKQEIERRAKREQDAAAEEKRVEFFADLDTDLNAFLSDIRDSVGMPGISTGFPNLDKALDGGLYPEFHILGAVSSAGKTAFVQQIADQVAANGTDVLFVSLEMSRTELISRSVSRHTLLLAMQRKLKSSAAKTARGITDGARWTTYSALEQDLILDAVDAYGGYSDRIKIKEGLGDVGTAEIRELVRQYIEYTDRRPLVIVDYLQIMSFADSRLSDKQNIDKAVLELKRISRDFRVPVIAIASLNRAGYAGRVSMADFKESGSIEYTAGVLLGLSFEGADDKDFDIVAAKAANPRRMQLDIIKQRGAGIPAEPLTFNYYPAFNYFAET